MALYVLDPVRDGVEQLHSSCQKSIRPTFRSWVRVSPMTSHAAAAVNKCDIANFHEIVFNKKYRLAVI